MKRLIFSLIAILALMSLACSVSVDMPKDQQTGELETLSIAEDAPSNSPADLTINMGGGTLEIGPGAGRFVEGTVEYNVETWKPVIERDDREITIDQKINDSSFFNRKVVNDWDLSLGNTPVNLTIQAGAYDGEIDLSGIPVHSLRISDGASKATVTFNLPNPVEMESFTYTTGASNIELNGLLNANFSEMNFKGGAGNYTLDFSGEMKQDVKVFIDGGLGNMVLVIPVGVNAQINVAGGLNNVSTQGTWTIEGQEYHTIGADGPLLKIQVNMGIGNLKLANR